ncbi:MAG: hypothetical protein ACJAUQ_001294, partial [Maribacter sp.]
TVKKNSRTIEKRHVDFIDKLLQIRVTSLQLN